MIIKIKKRDGRNVTFNIEKIANAIYKAAQSVGGSDYEEALELSGKVVDMLMTSDLTSPTVEQIQDCVEKVLIEEGHAATAKAYILYRRRRWRSAESDYASFCSFFLKKSRMGVPAKSKVERKC